jgi:hypothetical protein
MEGHPLAQGHFQGMVVEPAPPGGQAWHQFALLVEFDEVLEDIEGNPDPINRGLIHNPQFPPRCVDLFPYAALAPPEGHEHQDNTANHEVFHDCPSLASWLDAILPGLLLGGFGYKQ